MAEVPNYTRPMEELDVTPLAHSYGVIRDDVKIRHTGILVTFLGHGKEAPRSKMTYMLMLSISWADFHNETASTGRQQASWSAYTLCGS